MNFRQLKRKLALLLVGPECLEIVNQAEEIAESTRLLEQRMIRRLESMVLNASEILEQVHQLRAETHKMISDQDRANVDALTQRITDLNGKITELKNGGRQ